MAQRIYGLVGVEHVPHIDQAACEAQVSRAQWVHMAIESYLANGSESNSIDAVRLQEDAENLRTEKVELQTIIDEQRHQITHLTETLAEKNDEL